ncbi:SPFH domain-containing protein [Tundrisphaera lichenicola]|uniref:SPFH domain-containing protein n=1 Tax=Tundrisphaera lichenicola TaxID=2029860 RepID=UPI003EBFC468
MSRHLTIIIKETHRGLLYENGVLREILPAGCHRIPRAPSFLMRMFGACSPQVEVSLMDVRGRDLTVVVRDLLTADCATISASFVVHYRVADPRAAALESRNFEERLLVEAQTSARRTLRSLSLGEIIDGRDEIGEELHRLVGESAASFGLEVSALDFKDLALPLEVRDALNRAACASRLRSGDVDEADRLEEAEFGLGDRDSAVQETELRLARMTFDPRNDPSDEVGPFRLQGLEQQAGAPLPIEAESLLRFRS